MAGSGKPASSSPQAGRHPHGPGSPGPSPGTVWIERSIPPDSRILVAVGDDVSPTTPLALTKPDKGPFHRLEFARLLGCGPASARECLRVSVGDRVAEGELFALRTAFETPLSVVCPCDGRVALVSASLGALYVRERLPSLEGPVPVAAGVPGRITEIRRGRFIRIAVRGERVRGLFGVGGPVWGLLRTEEALRDPDLVRGAVVLLRDPPSSSLLQRLEEEGAAAVVVLLLDQAELVRYLGTEIRMGITPTTAGARMCVITLGGFDHPGPVPRPVRVRGRAHPDSRGCAAPGDSRALSRCAYPVSSGRRGGGILRRQTRQGVPERVPPASPTGPGARGRQPTGQKRLPRLALLRLCVL